MTTSDSSAHSRITLESEDGFPIPGTWQTRSGGARTATEIREREGGELFQEEVSAAPATTETETYSRSWKRDRDMGLWKWAYRNAGLVVLRIIEQPLDDRGNPFGDPVVSRGRLLGVNRYDVDSNETTARKRIEFTVSPFGDVA